MAGIKDVAKKAGVGVGTVSRMLNDSGYVADECNFSYRIQIKATSNPYNSLNPLTWSESP